MHAPLIKLFSFYFWLALGALLISLKVTADGNSELVYYVTCLVLAVFFASLSRFPKSKAVGFFWLFLSFLVLFIMYGLRDVSGIDDSSYERIFYEVLSEGWLQRFKETTMEPGYLLVNQLFGFFIDDYIYFQIFISFVSLFLFYKAFYDNKNDAAFEVAVFLMFCMILMQMQSVALVRMFLAMGIVALSFKYLAGKQVIRFIVYIFIAASIHYSALFLIFMAYFGLNKKALKKQMFVYYLLIVVMMPLVMLFILKFIIPLLGARYQQYASSEFSIKGSFLNTLPLIFICIYFFITKFKKMYSSNFYKEAYFKLLLFVFSLSFLVFLVASIAGVGRLVFYSYVAFILLIPIILRNIRRLDYYTLVSGVFILYGYLYVYRTQFVNIDHLPYFIPIKNILWS